MRRDWVFTPPEAVKYIRRTPAFSVAISALNEFHLHIEKVGFGFAGKVHNKSDGSPVTDLDLLMQNRIQRMLSRYYPNSQFQGEEGEHLPSAQVFSDTFFVDPLDGTSNLVKFMQQPAGDRRENCPDCNVLIGQQRPEDGVGIGCVVRLQEGVIFCADGYVVPHRISLKPKDPHILLEPLRRNQDESQGTIFLRGPRHNRWDPEGIGRTDAAMRAITQTLPSSHIVSQVNEAGNLMRLLMGEYDAAVVLPHTGHMHDLVAPINIIRAMPGVEFGNVLNARDQPDGVSSNYTDNGFVAAWDRNTYTTLQSSMARLYS